VSLFPFLMFHNFHGFSFISNLNLDLIRWKKNSSKNIVDCVKSYYGIVCNVATKTKQSLKNSEMSRAIRLSFHQKELVFRSIVHTMRNLNVLDHKLRSWTLL
jgi:hypothetical protein